MVRLLSGNSAVPDRWRPFHFLSYTTCKITAVNNTEQYSSPSSNPFCQLYIPVHISFKEIVASIQYHCHIGIFHVINTTSSSFVQNSYSAPTQRIAWLCQGCRRLACSVVCSCRWQSGARPSRLASDTCPAHRGPQYTYFPQLPAQRHPGGASSDAPAQAQPTALAASRNGAIAHCRARSIL